MIPKMKREITTHIQNIMSVTPGDVLGVVKAVVRSIFICCNNLYCIPAHILWLCFLQPLRWISESTYWKIEGVFFRWLLSMVAMWSYSAGYDIVECGDDITEIRKRKAIVLFNHQSTSDVPLIMDAFSPKGSLLDDIMWIMDKQFKHSNFGLVSVAHGDFFIQAGKEHRESSLAELKCHLKEFYLPRNRKWIVLFPEGGFLSKRKMTSQKFAIKNNLPHLENVTLPRIGAMKVILDEAVHDSQNGISGIEYVVDVTVAYPNGIPLDIWAIFSGRRPPCKTIFHYRKFSVHQIPREAEDLTQWLYERYYEKEKMLQTYYDSGVFPDHAKTNNELVTHDPLEFILRHLFYLCSTYILICFCREVLMRITSMLW